MPPKKKAGKGKKGNNDDDDEHWERLAAANKAKASPVATPAAAAQPSDVDEEEDRIVVARPTFNLADYGIEAQEGDDDDGDDLMAVLAKAKTSSSAASGGASGKKDKKGKKKDKKKVTELSDEEEAAAVEDKLESGGVEAGDDWMNELEKKPKKGGKQKGGKKGGKGKKAAEEEEEDDFDAILEANKAATAAVTATSPPPPTATPTTAATAPEPNAADEGSEAEPEAEEAAPTGVLSKAQKEKLKKEKEKAKKKAQAAAKKAAGGSSAPPPPPPSAPPTAAETSAPAPSSVPTAEGEDDDEGEEGEGGGAGGKNKKKKKKKTAADKAAVAPPPAAAAKGKGGAQMAALRALVEAQKAAAEEQARKVREEEERIEAEERRLEEEERLKAEEKAKKKEKEKAKLERLRKEGKLLTPKQKAEKAAAEIRRQALLSTSGVTIAGLVEGDDATTSTSTPTSSSASKKPVYAKKRKGPPASQQQQAQQAPTPEPSTPEPAAAAPVAEAAAAEAAKPEEDEDVKDDWDAESEEEKPVAVAKPDEDVKDDWDASSSESEKEEEKPAAAAPPVAIPPPKTAKPVAKKVPAPVSAAATKKTPAAAPAAAAKPAVKAPSKPAAKVVPAQDADDDDDDDSDDSENGSDDDSDDDDSDSDDSDSDSDSDDSEEDSSDDEETKTATQREAQKRKDEARERRLAKQAEALKNRSKDDMRSPICVILGHVDTGKTKLLDKIRQTNVQEGEAGGITQQIGATFFPMEAIKSKTQVLGAADLKEYKLPGLLVIDTPGHESFTNLRTRGSSLCNIAILVVDIMHGLEPQTLESLRLLREGKTPFIVALNKIDRLYGWKAIPNGGFQDSLAAQDSSVQREFKNRLDSTVLAFAEQGLNSAPYYENKNFSNTVSLVPTSAHTGEGVPDMLMLIIKLTQERMAERLMYISTLECTVLEVKVIEGLGTTIDVVLSNGVLREGDKIVVCGLNGPITTQVRALLTPQPMKELRVKGQYVPHKEVKASLGIKISAPDLEKAIAGSRLLVVGEDDDEDELREEVMSDLTNLMNSVDKSGRGVSVQASTLGSLEALLEFLRTSKIPVSGINIGPVHRKDVMRAAAMLEKAKELSVILCFDVPVDKEAEQLAEELGIRIFKADIIYHLFDQFTAYNAKILEAKRADQAPRAVWPVRLKILMSFAKRDPIIIGCDILEGSLRIGTPLCVVKTDPETKKKDIISLGKITSLQINHKEKQVVKKHEVGAGVAVKIEHASYESAKQYGRHFDDKDEVIAMISRQSIDVLKTHFRDDVPKEDWLLIKNLKTRLDIP